MTLYLLDANVLITADKTYYPIQGFKPFWDWVLVQCQAGHIKMPFEIYDEVAGGNDDVAAWLQLSEVKGAILLAEEVNDDLLNNVLATAYASDLTDTELDKAGRDPFLIAYAKADARRVVVTKEVSATRKVRGNRKIPDACDICGIPWMDDFGLYRVLNFQIS